MSASPPAAANERILLRTDEGGVATLTLNHPEKFNVLSEAMLDALEAALADIEADDRVRVVVIAGTGKAFCAGHHLQEMRSHHDQGYYEKLFAQCSRVMTGIVRLPKPVIARVHGVAAAAGCQLVASCDLAVASTEASFAVSGVNLALFCSSPSVALSRNLSRKQAFEMLITGDFVDAETAVEKGLVNRAVPPEKLDVEIRSLTDSIGSKPAVAIATGKRMFYRQIEMNLDDAYEYAGKTMACNIMHEDTVEGVDAFLEKRAPRWS